MIAIFKNIKLFSVLFFSILLIDILVKQYLEAVPYRYISKPLVILLLLIFYIINANRKDGRNFILMTIGIIAFMVGDIFLIKGGVSIIFLAIGISFFVLGKAFYCFRFSHTKDFNVKRLVPFFLACFVYVIILFIFIYDNLGNMFVPAIIYLFVAIMLLQFAYLRKDAVSNLSYNLVLIGALISVFSDSIIAIKEFYSQFPYQEILIMLIYGISQYFIITGLVRGDQDELKLIHKK